MGLNILARKDAPVVEEVIKVARAALLQANASLFL